MDLLTIKDKITTYTSFNALIADVQWMLHNSWILFSGKATAMDDILREKTPLSIEMSQFFVFSSANNRHIKIVTDLIDFIKIEVQSMKKCAECYFNANKYPTWFTMVCGVPHCIVWAKVEGYSYWPAKVMSIDGQQVHVRFFGDHTHADVLASRCFLYSYKSPDEMRRKSTIERNFVRNTTNKTAWNVSICRKGSFLVNFIGFFSKEKCFLFLLGSQFLHQQPPKEVRFVSNG